MRTTTTLAILSVLIATPISSRADEGCGDWFCEEEKPANSPKIGPDSAAQFSGQDVAVELQDGSIVRGVVVEIALDHVTIAVGATKVTVAWPQVVSIRVNPTAAPAPTPAPAPAPAPTEPESDASDEEPAKDDVVVEEVSKPPQSPKPAPTELVEPESKPALEPGLFALGARAKLIAALEGGRFYNGGGQIADFATGGVGYELSFAIRLTNALMLRAAYDHAELFRGERNFSGNDSPTSDAVGIGVRWLFGNAPDVRGVFEAGVGYRWLRVPYASGAAPDSAPRRPGAGIATYEGAQSLRTAIGAAFPIDDHGRFEVLLEGSFGRFTRVHDDNAEVRDRTLADGATTTHAFLGIAVGLELGP
jgi:hypothetical protein